MKTTALLAVLLAGAHAQAVPGLADVAASAVAVTPSGTVNLDLKSADIRSVLTRLGETGRVNVVLAEDVQGQVTLRMRNVPWQVAMHEVLLAKGLDWERDGNVVWIAKANAVERDRVARFNKTWCTPETKLPANTFCKKMEP